MKKRNYKFSELRTKNHSFLSLLESQNTENTITYLIVPKWDWQQFEFREEAFNAAFDDYILYNNNYGLGNEIDSTMSSMIDDDPEAQNLAEYVDANLEGKVKKINLHWDAKGNHLVATVHLAAEVVPEDVKDAVWEYLEGQMADGWGEGFEQQEIAHESVYAVYNENDDYDVEVFYDENQAIRECEEKNEQDDEYDEDGEDSDSYSWCECHLSLYCHFWERYGTSLLKTYINGYDENGWDMDGYDKEGRDSRGLDKDGYDKEGYDRNGRDKEGFDKKGFDKNGKDREGFDVNGEKDLADNRPANKSGRKNGALFTQRKDGTVRIKNTFDMGESRKRR